MEKRKDSRGRLLHKGESQRKDGRYVFKYTVNGKTKFLYSRKLVPTDKVTDGRDCVALRVLEKEVRRDIEDGIDTAGKKMTLCELYAKQNESRANVKKSTVRNRKRLMEVLKHDPLGNTCIDSIKPSDAKQWAVRMKSIGYAYGTISNYKRSLMASYYIAIEDDCVRKNPFSFNLKDILQNDTKPKTALTQDQKQALLAFTETDSTYKSYHHAIVILLNTGLRISELCGLEMSDIDFSNKIINIDHQLIYDKDGYYIDTPKSESGIRKVPMTDTVCKAFREVIRNRQHAKPIVIDGHSDFLFLKKSGLPMYNVAYFSVFKRLIKKYNRYHEGNELPDITPHVLRHTFCTDMANKGMTPNNLQYIMGHKNVTMTLGYYAHGCCTSAMEEMQRLSI